MCTLKIVLLLTAVERLDGQRLDVNDRRFESPRQYVHRGRMVPEQQDGFDRAHVGGTENLTVYTARFVMLFPAIELNKKKKIKK